MIEKQIASGNYAYSKKCVDSHTLCAEIEKDEWKSIQLALYSRSASNLLDFTNTESDRQTDRSEYFCLGFNYTENEKENVCTLFLFQKNNLYNIRD